MTPDAIIIACDLRQKIAQLEAYAAHAEFQAANPPARVAHVELFTEDRAEHARMLRARISTLRDELDVVEGQGALRFSRAS